MGRSGYGPERMRLDYQIQNCRITRDGAIAQLGERYNGIVEVSGSIPLSSTNRTEGTRQEAGFFVPGASVARDGGGGIRRRQAGR